MNSFQGVGSLMKNKDKLYSIKSKMHIFVMLTVLIVALGTAAVAFYTSVDQIDTYYKRCANDNAKNFASMVDGDFLEQLRIAAETEEFQQIRIQAAEEENEAPVREYLIRQGLWDQYAQTRSDIDRYLENMKDIRYLYIIANGDRYAAQDMYLLDSSEEPIYETGYYEDREAELLGMDITNLKEPTISNGDWGWLCSAFSPVYNSKGECICVIGCDFGMEDVMKERRQFQIYLLVGALLLTVIVQFIATHFMDKTVVKPLDTITSEMKKFKPAKNLTYREAGVMNLPIKSKDEIGALYLGIRTMQIDTIDHLNSLVALQEDKMKAEQDIKDKEKQIDQLSEENNKDTLTGVGSKSAYAKKVEELNKEIAKGTAEFAIVMIDMNNLKKVNDECGHKAGDQYIIGCCHMICSAFKHSPVYRIGGDEFIVIVQGTDYPARYGIFNDLKRKFEQSYSQINKEMWLRYSASMGIAENGSEDTTVDLVFRNADKAMYEHKKEFKDTFGSYR